MERSSSTKGGSVQELPSLVSLTERSSGSEVSPNRGHQHHRRPRIPLVHAPSQAKSARGSTHNKTCHKNTISHRADPNTTFCISLALLVCPDVRVFVFLDPRFHYLVCNAAGCRYPEETWQPHSFHCLPSWERDSHIHITLNWAEPNYKRCRYPDDCKNGGGCRHSPVNLLLCILKRPNKGFRDQARVS